MGQESRKRKVDFHVHTSASLDGLSTLEEVAQAAKAAGLQGVAIADHNRFSLGEEREVNGCWLLPACECSTKEGHVLALFCQEIPTEGEDSFPMATGGQLPGAQEVIAAIHQRGGLAVVAHPFEKKERDLSSLGPLWDGVEGENGRAWMRNPQANEMARAYGKQYHKPLLGGSDAHSATCVGYAYTVVEGNDPRAWEQALREGKTEAVFHERIPRREKGRSQWAKAKRAKGNPPLWKAAAYYIRCLILDLVHK